MDQQILDAIKLNLRQIYGQPESGLTFKRGDSFARDAIVIYENKIGPNITNIVSQAQLPYPTMKPDRTRTATIVIQGYDAYVNRCGIGDDGLYDGYRSQTHVDLNCPDSINTIHKLVWEALRDYAVDLRLFDSIHNTGYSAAIHLFERYLYSKVNAWKS
jgi:hypothetical protein